MLEAERATKKERKKLNRTRRGEGGVDLPWAGEVLTGHAGKEQTSSVLWVSSMAARWLQRREETRRGQRRDSRERLRRR
jgi:hypothetical protein